MAENETITNIEDPNKFYRNQKFYYLIIKVPFTLIPGIFGMIYERERSLKTVIILKLRNPLRFSLEHLFNHFTDLCC